MLMRIVMSALLAGALAGTLVFAGHMWKTTPLILQAEVYENGPAEGAGGHAHSHAQDQAQKQDQGAAAGHSHGAAAGDDEGWSPGDGLERHAFTLLLDVITAVGFAFILIGAMAISGEGVGWRRGIVWGLCGYAAFYVAPAMGLAPELPGMAYVDVVARQTWWACAAAATAAALALMFFASGTLWKIAAVILLVLPHMFGVPHPDFEAGDVPAELAAQFAVATLVVTGLFWMALGSLSGYFYDRFGDTA